MKVEVRESKCQLRSYYGLSGWPYIAKISKSIEIISHRYGDTFVYKYYMCNLRTTFLPIATRSTVDRKWR